MSKILHAEPGARPRAFRTLTLVAAVCALGVALLSARLQYLGRMPSESPEDAQLAVAAVYELLIGSAVLATCLAAYFILRRSVHAFLHGEFPPPGTRVLRDTAVLTGAAARTIASVGMVLGVLLVGCAGMLVVLLAQLEMCLGRFS